MGIYSLFVVFMLFQVLVVFNGRSLENNDMARYIVVDILHKRPNIYLSYIYVGGWSELSF